MSVMQLPGFDNEMPSERLITSVVHENVAGVKAALAAGADANFNRSGTPILIQAIIGGNEEIVQDLISAGADVNLGNRRGWLPVHEAARRGLDKIIPLLAKAPMAFLEMDCDGELPLHLAASEGHAGALRALLDAGAGVDPRDQTNRSTPLMRAVDGHHRDAVSVLLAAGANPDQPDQEGRSARDRLEDWPDGADLFAGIQAVAAGAVPSRLPVADQEEPADAAPATPEIVPAQVKLGIGQVRKRGPR